MAGKTGAVARQSRRASPFQQSPASIETSAIISPLLSFSEYLMMAPLER
jgi:hypothetical protein